jgi:phage tail tape-measure protein
MSLAGAVYGAGMGCMFGPTGVATGALIGGAFGFVAGKTIGDDRVLEILSDNIPDPDYNDYSVYED